MFKPRSLHPLPKAEVLIFLYVKTFEATAATSEKIHSGKTTPQGWESAGWLGYTRSKNGSLLAGRWLTKLLDTTLGSYPTLLCFIYGTTRNAILLFITPLAVVTSTKPVFAPTGTTAVK